jgi:hypothetical protein
VATLVILYALRAVFGSLRVDDEAEFVGLDLAEHSESAYEFGTASGTSTAHLAATVHAPTGSPAPSKA